MVFKHQTPRKLIKTRLLFLLVIMILVIILFWLVKPFSVKEIKLDGSTECFNSGSIKKLNLYGQNLLLLSENRIAVDIQKQYPCIAEISVSKMYPNTILLTVKNRVPAIMFRQTIPGKSVEITAIESTKEPLISRDFPIVTEQELGYRIDQSGLVLDNQPDDTLPIIFLASPQLKIGQQLDPKLINTILYLNNKVSLIILQSSLANGHGQQIMGKVTNRSLILNTKPYLLFSLDNPIEKQVASLQLILKEAKMDISKIDTVDLRFDKPVVEFVKTSSASSDKLP